MTEPKALFEQFATCDRHGQKFPCYGYTEKDREECFFSVGREEFAAAIDEILREERKKLLDEVLEAVREDRLGEFVAEQRESGQPGGGE